MVVMLKANLYFLDHIVDVTMNSTTVYTILAKMTTHSS